MIIKKEHIFGFPKKKHRLSFCAPGRYDHDDDADRIAKGNNNDTGGETAWWWDCFDRLGSTIIIMDKESTGSLTPDGLDSFVSTATSAAVCESG